MYNGIGVQTPRGTGTSGYIETSLVSLKPPPLKQTKSQKYVPKQSKALEEHNKRRKIELSCIKLRQKLEKSKKSEEEIKTAVKNYRAKLLEAENLTNKIKKEEQQEQDTEENQQVEDNNIEK